MPYVCSIWMGQVCRCDAWIWKSESSRGPARGRRPQRMACCKQSVLSAPFFKIAKLTEPLWTAVDFFNQINMVSPVSVFTSALTRALAHLPFRFASSTSFQCKKRLINPLVACSSCMAPSRSSARMSNARPCVLALGMFFVRCFTGTVTVSLTTGPLTASNTTGKMASSSRSPPLCQHQVSPFPSTTYSRSTWLIFCSST